MGNWRVASNGSGKHHWFVFLGEAPEVRLLDRYLYRADGRLRWFGSRESAQKVADKMNNT